MVAITFKDESPAISIKNNPTTRPASGSTEKIVTVVMKNVIIHKRRTIGFISIETYAVK